MDTADTMPDRVAWAREASSSQPVSVLDRQDRRLIRQLLPRLVTMRLQLSLRGYGPVQAKLAERLADVPIYTPDDAALRRAARAGRIVGGLGRRMPFDAACLVQSLALWSFLREEGLPVQVQIGVAKANGLAAHAWVNMYGEPISDSPEALARFSRFDRIGS